MTPSDLSSGECFCELNKFPRLDQSLAGRFSERLVFGSGNDPVLARLGQVAEVATGTGSALSSPGTSPIRLISGLLGNLL